MYTSQITDFRAALRGNMTPASGSAKRTPEGSHAVGLGRGSSGRSSSLRSVPRHVKLEEFS